MRGLPAGTEDPQNEVVDNLPRYLYTTGLFKRRVFLKQQFTIEKGYYDPVYNTPYSEPDGLRVSIIAHSSSTAQNY